MGEDNEARHGPDNTDDQAEESGPTGTDEEAVLARRMFFRAGLVAVPLALASFAVSRPARAQATCMPQFCSPGEPCNPVLCGPQLCNPAD